MSGHKVVSISSLLSPRIDDIEPNIANTSFSNDITNVNKVTLESPFTEPMNPIPPVIPIQLEKVKSAEVQRKISSPMSVMNLMNSPILETHNQTQTSSNDVDIPIIQETTLPTKIMENVTKKKGVISKKDVSISDKKDKSKKYDSMNEPEQESGPIIVSIDIPLSTHNDIHTEHNFSKLVEEKYGSNETQAPLAKGLWNFDGDDQDGDYDDEEEEDADLDGETTGISNGIINNNEDEDEDDIVKALKIKFTPGMNDMEKESLVLKEIHRRKMVNNKRIGKYDIDDPFIDDEELEFEEETGANADGWFIWHGKLDISKKKKVSSPESKIDKNIKYNKTNTTGMVSASKSKPYNSNNSTLLDIATISPTTSEIDKRRKATTSNSELPTLKKAKKVGRADKIEKIVDKKNEINDKLEDKTKKSTASKEQVNVPAKEVPAKDVSDNKLIIGSFGFGV